jgi:TPR repeat protein
VEWQSNSAFSPSYTGDYSYANARMGDPGQYHDSSASNQSLQPQHVLRYRRSSGALGSISMPYNPNSRSEASTPASDRGASPASQFYDRRSPDSELLEFQALSIQPRQQSLQQQAQFPANPQRIMPQVAVYNVAEHRHPQYAMEAEMVGDSGHMMESMEQLPQPKYPNQYTQAYGYGPSNDVQRSTDSLPRPRSTNTTGSGSYSESARHIGHRAHLSTGGSPSPMASPMLRPQTQGKHSPDHRPQSYIDLLQTPYAQQVAPSPNLDNSFLRQIVGKNASLLEASKTLDAYRANVKNISDPAIQYEFAVFMVQTALELPPDTQGPPSKADLIKDARQILQKLVDKSYPFAQYYLADGYASGLFNKGKEDYDRAFPLFVAAAKRGHAEAAYRAALCHELGWGCRKDYNRAVKFYEMSASKNHPGAATRLGLAGLHDLMGLSGKYRDGYKWLKRAAESADAQYNSAPYELAKLHEHGFGADIFKDEGYAAQLFTESANLGHPDANLVMGKAYEHGFLGCPQDAMLSIHFYTGAANAGEPEGMMALCAWYLFGAEPLLPKNEFEAFEWAKRATETGRLLNCCLCLTTNESRICKGRICCRILQGNGNRLQTRHNGSKPLVLASCSTR